MYHVSAQGVDERVINVHYYYKARRKSDTYNRINQSCGVNWGGGGGGDIVFFEPFCLSFCLSLPISRQCAC